MLLDGLIENFSKINKTVSKGVLQTVEAMMRCSSSNTSKVSRELSIMNNKSFKTNDMWLYRLFGNKKFQLDDNFWRCYINTIFQILADQNQIAKDEKILINIDFTSDRDDFLILCASVTLGDNAIPLYFTMRNYPKKKGQYNHKKMELAFIKALKHILSVKYQYVIVADRGFGNDRFIELCIENGFDIMIRLQPNMTIKTDGRQGIAEKILTKDGEYNCHIKSWKKNYNIIRHSKGDKTWYLLTNMITNKGLGCAAAYAKRFRIEKLFQNLKSSGFDIESSKIKKYDRFKRMLFLSCFAQGILVLLGKFINEKLPDIKKNSPISTNLLIASSSLENSLSIYTKKEHIK
jgi:hypothetical protein